LFWKCKWFKNLRELSLNDTPMPAKEERLTAVAVRNLGPARPCLILPEDAENA
jgi:hypothetical protein